MKHLDLWHGLDADLKQSLIKQLRNLWTHTSTALEGNTLSLGETAFVLEEGLTVGGKPLKDHEVGVGWIEFCCVQRYPHEVVGVR